MQTVQVARVKAKRNYLPLNFNMFLLYSKASLYVNLGVMTILIDSTSTQEKSPSINKLDSELNWKPDYLMKHKSYATHEAALTLISTFPVKSFNTCAMV